VRVTRALLLAALLAGWSAEAAEPVKIGELNSYTAVPAFTVPYRNGWQMALDEINKAGGVMGGRKLEVISRDDRAQVADALAAAAELKDKDGVVLLTGSLLGHVAQALSDWSKANRLPYLAVMPLGDDLVWAKGNRYSFRLRPSASMQSAMLAEPAAKLPAKKWAIIAPDFEQGRAFAADFKQALKARRPDVTFVSEQYPPLGKLEAETVVRSLEQAKPDAIFNATFAGDLIRLIREGRDKGLFKNRPVFSVQTGEPEILDVMAEDAPDGWIVTGYPWNVIKTPEHRKFVEAYMAAYSEDPRMGALLGYVAMKAIAAALDKAGSTDPEKLVAAFEGLSLPTPAGAVTFRAADHQSTLGSWVGKTVLQDGSGEMVDWSYQDGAKYLPAPDAAKALRPKN